MWVAERAREPELMDDLSLAGAELRQALGQLRVINRVLGAAWLTLEGVVRLWRQAGRPRQLTLVDAGAGSGEQNRLLLHWARRSGVDLRITLVDIHPDTCAEARRYFDDEPRVEVRCQDLRQLPVGAADIVTASMVLHHFPGADLPGALHALRSAARIGVVVNDLHRHWLAWGAMALATRLLSRNRMIRHDAPLSVRRGFTAADLRQLMAEPGLSRLCWRWRPLFRYLILLDGGGRAV